MDEYEAQWRIVRGGRHVGGPAHCAERERHLHPHGRAPVLVDLRVPCASPRGRLHLRDPLGNQSPFRETVETASCPPVFDEASYTFDVAENAELDDVVGTVSATDPDMDDDVRYDITAGNTGTAFDVDDETGEITVAAALDHETTASYNLTVEADDGNGQTDTVTVSHHSDKRSGGRRRRPRGTWMRRCRRGHSA